LPLLLPGPDEEFGTADDVIDTGVVGDTDLVARIGAVVSGAIPPPAGVPGGAAVQTLVAGGGTTGVGAETSFTVLVSDGSGSPPYGNVLATNELDSRPVAIYAFADLDGDGVIGPTDADGSDDNELERQEATGYVGRQVGSLAVGRHTGSIGVNVAAPASIGGLAVMLSAGAYTGSDVDEQFSDGTPIHTLWPYFPPLDPSRVIGNGNSPPPDPNLPSELKFEPEKNYLPPPGHALLGTPFAVPTDGSEPTVDGFVSVSGPVHAARFFDELADDDFRSISRIRLRPAPSEAGTGRVLVKASDQLAIDADAGSTSRTLRLLPVDLFGNIADPDGGLSVELKAVGGVDIIAPDTDGDTKFEEIVLSTAAGASVELNDSGTPGIARIDILSGPRVLGTLPVVVGSSAFDGDADGVAEDGNASAIAGDLLCNEDDVVAGISCDDNCADLANPGQYDSDRNGLGDCCDGVCAVDPLHTGCDQCEAIVPPIPSGILEKAKLRLKTPGNGKPDRLSIQGRFVLGTGDQVDPTSEDVSLVVTQSAAVRYAVVLSGAFERKTSASKFRYRDPEGLVQGVEKSDISGRDGIRFKFKLKAEGTSLLSLDGEPVGLDVGIGNDAFAVLQNCEAKATRVLCK
jgi:hypothetical protein